MLQLYSVWTESLILQSWFMLGLRVSSCSIIKNQITEYQLGIPLIQLKYWTNMFEQNVTNGMILLLNQQNTARIHVYPMVQFVQKISLLNNNTTFYYSSLGMCCGSMMTKFIRGNQLIFETLVICNRRHFVHGT